MTSLKAFEDAVAERGLEFVGFDGHTLNLIYNSKRDRVFQSERRPVGGDELNRFVLDAMNEASDVAGLFPGIKKLHIAFDLGL